MKKLTLLGLLMLTLCIPLLVNGCGQKTSKEIILASFDKQVVTANELEKEITELPEWKQDKYKDQAGREEYLTLMAESRMILDVAKKAKLEKNPEIIKQVKEFQDGIMRDELTKREIDDKVKVSDLDVEKYYAENKEKYIEPEMVVATEITVKDEARAKEILDNVKTGADFTEIAKEVDSKGESFGPGQGNGGKTRPFSKDAYSSAKNFVEATFNLKQGEISDIITQSLGEETFYIITRQDERQPSRQKELSEVKDDIKRNVESDMKDTRKKSWMAQLKEEKKVEIFADKIPKDPEPKPESENKSETEVKPAEGESAKTNTDNQAVEKPKESEPAKIDTAKQAVKDEVLAKIGKVTVTLNELNKNISEMPEWKQDRYKDQEGKKKYLDELVEEKLLNVVIYDQKLDKDPEISRQAKEYRDQLMLKELVKREVDDKVKIEDPDLAKYYEEHKAEYVEPEKVAVTEITLKDEKKANEVMDKIKAGADFTALAKEMDAKNESSGPGQGNEGKTRPFSKDSYSSAKVFVDAAFNLKQGEMSDIIVQPMGQNTFYMIIRKDEYLPTKQQELSDVKDDVTSNVEKDKKKARIEQWLEEMKKEMNFKLFVDRIPKPVEKKDEAQQKTESEVKQEGTESGKDASTQTKTEDKQEQPKEESK